VEEKNELKEIIDNGIRINADVSVQLLKNIFSMPLFLLNIPLIFLSD